MVKVKVLERFKDKFLIQRYYRDLNISEFIVCRDYNFKANIYGEGIILFSLPDSYRVFNKFCQDDSLPEIKDDDNGVFAESDRE